jgi:hypothetical protein
MIGVDPHDNIVLFEEFRVEFKLDGVVIKKIMGWEEDEVLYILENKFEGDFIVIKEIFEDQEYIIQVFAFVAVDQLFSYVALDGCLVQKSFL